MTSILSVVDDHLILEYSNNFNLLIKYPNSYLKYK